MRDRLANLTRFAAVLLLAGFSPLHAQFTTYGCFQTDFSQHINGFTAGTTSDSGICLVGTFQPNVSYDVTLTRTDTNAAVTVSGLSQGNLITATVTAASNFYAQINGTQPVPVNVSIVVPKLSGTNQTGTFQINPPMVQGGPVFVGAVGNQVTWTTFTGGTLPTNQEFEEGSGPPPGFQTPPFDLNTWTGTPTTAGTYSFGLFIHDVWGNQLNTSQTAYIVPAPQITNVTPAAAGVGSNTVPLTITGTGFVQPQLVESVAEPGSTVLATIGKNSPIILTPKNISDTSIAVDLPANLLTVEGPIQLSVNNLDVATSNSFVFTVEPVINSLVPTVRTAGTGAFPLTVLGAGFAPGANVVLNGSILPTTFVNSNTLRAIFPSIPNPGTQQILVTNLDETFTNTVPFIILPAPVLTALIPNKVNAGGPAFTLLLSGSDFQQGMSVFFDANPLGSTLVQNQKNDTLSVSVPAALIARAANVLVSAVTTDSSSTASLTFVIQSTGPPPLQITTFAPLPGGTVNVAYSTTIGTSGGAGGNVFSLSDGTLPAGLQLSADGVISGTPSAFGASQFTVQVTDSAHTSVSRTFNLNIAPAPLTLTTGPLANTQVGSAVNVQFAATGGVPPYTFVEFGALPPGITFSNAGLLSGTPTKAGTFPLQVFVDDSNKAFAGKNYTLNVALPGLLITTPSPLTAGQINVPYSDQLAATGGAGAPFTWTATGLPNGLTIANNTGLIAGIPRASGSFTVAVTISDSLNNLDTQSYALTIAPAGLTFSGGTLANGAVGISYTSVVSVTGGIGPYTFTATGLPPGLTLSSTGTLSGTPTTAGTFSPAVTATDTAGGTVSGNFNVTIAPQLTVNTVSIPNGTVGTAIAPVKLTASGGASPYRFQSANLPPGLSLAADGTLSGTPTAGGTFSFTVFVVDNNGSLASGTEQFTVGLPPTAPATVTGVPSTAPPGSQQTLNVTLSTPFSAPVTANLSLAFAPTSGADDPNVQFSSGGRTAQILIPAGSTSGVTAVGVQTGTVAGTITITAQLLSGTTNVTPNPAPTTTIVIPAAAPVLTGVTATRTSTGLTVSVTGFSSSREVDSVAFTFSPTPGSTLTTTTLSPPVSSLFSTYFTGASSAKFGSEFVFTQPFNVSGSASSIFSVSVTLTSPQGTSSPLSATLQ